MRIATTIILSILWLAVSSQTLVNPTLTDTVYIVAQKNGIVSFLKYSTVTGGAGSVQSDGFTILGDGSAGDKFRVDTSVMATLFALADTAAAIRASGGGGGADGNGIYSGSGSTPGAQTVSLGGTLTWSGAPQYFTHDGIFLEGRQADNGIAFRMNTTNGTRLHIAREGFGPDLLRCTDKVSPVTDEYFKVNSVVVRSDLWNVGSENNAFTGIGVLDDSGNMERASKQAFADTISNYITGFTEQADQFTIIGVGSAADKFRADTSIMSTVYALADTAAAIRAVAAADGNGIYDGSGSTPGAQTVSLGGTLTWSGASQYFTSDGIIWEGRQADNGIAMRVNTTNGTRLHIAAEGFGPDLIRCTNAISPVTNEYFKVNASVVRSDIWNVGSENNAFTGIGVLDDSGNMERASKQAFADTLSNYGLGSIWSLSGTDAYYNDNVLIGSSTGNGARLFVLGAPTTGTEIATFRSQTSLTDTRYQNSTTGSTNNDGTRVRQTGNNFSIQNLESTGTIQIGINNSVDLAITVDHDVQIDNDLILNATNSIREITGTGSPEGAVNGGAGSTYRQTNGSAGTIQWIKETGTGNTGWVPNGAHDAITDTTDGSGDITVTHGLGYTPTEIQLTVSGTTAYHVQYHNITSTTFDIRVFDASGSAVASTSVDLTYWAR